MYKLFISTYNEIILIGLIKENTLIQKLEKETYQNHSKFLVPMINEIIKNNKITLKDLKEIIVVNGPGSFTGTRLGVVVAKTLAYTLNIKIRTITSIEAISKQIEDKNKIISITDSKGKYLGIYIEDTLINEIMYIKNEMVDKYLIDYPYNIYENQKIDLEKILYYIKDLKEVNPHNANPIYIKTLEVQSAK